MTAEADNTSAMTAASNSAVSGDASVSSSGQGQREQEQQKPKPPPATAKKKRNLPGTPDPDAEVVALSPRTLLATNRFVCDVCGKGFQRDQNLQLHRRGHNLPWKLRRTGGRDGGDGGPPARRKRVYVCPEESCVHHHPSRALGDLTGIKKHFCRKHGEKKWRCDRCSKKYAVMSDWKAHCKTCGLREYRCDCGTVFSRRDSFITHRAFCDALAEETARVPPPLPPVPPSTADSVTTEEVDPNVGAASLTPEVAAVASPPMLASPLRSPSEEQQPQSAMEKKDLDDTDNTGPTQHGIPPSRPQPVKVASSVDNLHQRQSCSGGNSSHETVTGGGMFVGLFSPAPPPVADQKPQVFAELAPTNTPPSIGLSAAAAGLSLFAAPPSQLSPAAPHMSATALLQKAAQMGAAATNASLLRGFGLAPTSSASVPSSSLVMPDTAGLSAGLGLGLLPYESCAGGFAELVMGGAGGQSSFCGPRPSATLDFLGLGMAGAGAGAAGGGLTALFTSIAGTGPDLTQAGGPFGSEMLDRKPPTGLR